ncbi:uncharacterized protein LOC106665211 [Cimex lectularius]|uniref:CPR type cuticle protein n=1 Tax=Cimex lectularius TaxID=79782 RepID=A0A8I6RKR4_CIMLE|nr:uncharacterized protein LOC106665211 [Cimex lectularius]
MKFFAVLLAVVGAASAGLAPVLLPKVNVAPTQVNVVRQPVTVTQPELVYRNVPVPVKAVAYTNPVVSTPVVAAPVVAAYAAPYAHAPLTTFW